MVSFKSLLSFVAVANLATTANCVPSVPSYGGKPGCGQVNIFFSGLPANHPLVTAQGFDPAQVSAAMTADAAAIRKAGYNLRVVLQGPEQPQSNIANELRGINWQGTGVGYGIRGSRLPNVTVYFEDLIETYRERADRAFFLFNNSPNSSITAIQRRFPLSSDCANSPGKDLGTKTFCTICT